MFLHKQKQCGKSGGTPGQKYDESHYDLAWLVSVSEPVCVLYEGSEGNVSVRKFRPSA